MSKIIKLNLLIILIIALLAIAAETIHLDSMQDIHATVEGDSSHLKEMINALIDSEVLSHDDDGWRLNSPVGDLAIPSKTSGIRSERLERLNKEIEKTL
jgi:hypothetical protein